jgi:hypothetical protein
LKFFCGSSELSSRNQFAVLCKKSNIKRLKVFDQTLTSFYCEEEETVVLTYSCVTGFLKEVIKYGAKPCPSIKRIV